MTRHRVCNYTTDVTRGEGTAYPSGAPEFIPSFSGIRVTRSLVLYVCFVDRYLSFCPLSFDHCVVCSSSIYGFWLPLWYLQTLLRIRFLSWQGFFCLFVFFCFLFFFLVLPRRDFTPLIHCSNNRIALCPASYATWPHPLQNIIAAVFESNANLGIDIIYV